LVYQSKHKIRGNTTITATGVEWRTNIERDFIINPLQNEEQCKNDRDYTK